MSLSNISTVSTLPRSARLIRVIFTMSLCVIRLSINSPHWSHKLSICNDVVVNESQGQAVLAVHDSDPGPSNYKTFVPCPAYRNTHDNSQYSQVVSLACEASLDFFFLTGIEDA